MLLTIFGDHAYIYIPYYISNSCTALFQYSAATWWNPSVPLCSKPYWWCYLMADLTTPAVTGLKINAALVKVTKLVKIHQN